MVTSEPSKITLAPRAKDGEGIRGMNVGQRGIFLTDKTILFAKKGAGNKHRQERICFNASLSLVTPWLFGTETYKTHSD